MIGEITALSLDLSAFTHWEIGQETLSHTVQLNAAIFYPKIRSWSSLVAQGAKDLVLPLLRCRFDP